MKRACLNVSIDAETDEGAKLIGLILSSTHTKGWLVASWVDRTKYNPVELLKQSEEARRIAVEEAIKFKCEADEMAAWIEKACDKMVYYELHKPSETPVVHRQDYAEEFSKLIDEAPI